MGCNLFIWIYGWALSQKLPINNFEWIEETSQFNGDFIKNYNKEEDEAYFLELDILDNLPFLPERMQLKK